VQDDRCGVRRGVSLVLLVAAVLVPAATPAGARSSPGIIAFVRTCCETLGDAQSDVFVARADGTGRPRAVTHLVNVSEASWSADRRWLAITRPRLNPVLFVGRSSGGKLRRISVGAGPVLSPMLSPDGRLIAYEQESSGAASVWVSTTSGATQRIGFGVPGAWDPTKPRTLAYSSEDGIHLADVAHHSQHLLFRGNFNRAIGWSPDGRRIVAHAFSWPNHARRPTKPDDIYVYSLASGKRTNVSHTGGWDSYPAWSPDGRRIAWSTTNAIWVVNADGSGKRRLTSLKAKSTSVLEPTWSPDGHSIIFVRGFVDACQLYLVRITGGSARPLFAPQDQPTGGSACDIDPVWFR
jgi:Tol biopolymer transport system component